MTLGFMTVRTGCRQQSSEAMARQHVLFRNHAGQPALGVQHRRGVDAVAEEEVGGLADRLALPQEDADRAHHVAGDDAAEDRFPAPRIGRLQLVGVGERFVADHAIPPRLLAQSKA